MKATETKVQQYINHYKNMKKQLIFIESKGDVHFYKDADGNQYQQLGSNEPFKVRDGKMTYKFIGTESGFDIKYNNNGVHGFAIFKGKKSLEDNIWTYAEAQRIAKSMKPW